MAESKVQKVARQGVARGSVGSCECGGELTWTRLATKGSKMVKACMKCGAIKEQPRGD